MGVVAAAGRFLCYVLLVVLGVGLVASGLTVFPFADGRARLVLVCLIVLTIVLALSAAITSALGVTGTSRVLGGTALILVEGADGDDLQGLGIQQRVVIADLALAVGLNASQRLEVEGTALRITDVKAHMGGRPVPHGRRSHVRVPAGGH